MSNSTKPKQARIVKLNKIKLDSPISCHVYETPCGSNAESEEFDVSGEYLTKLYVIKNYKGDLVYGDLPVREGDYVYFISESEFYYFVENKHGVQGNFFK